MLRSVRHLAAFPDLDSLFPPPLRPCASGDDKDGKEDDDGDVSLEDVPKTARARRWAVIFWNDDYTMKWFVVHVLEQFFHMNETTATAFMTAVHDHGKGAAGVYTRDIAETKAAAVMDYAREFEMPLKVTAEPDDPDDG
jgi:ATP-dependent Clp protease adaptor protein ClpS